MKTCISITGGNYDIIFNTDSDQKLENMSICIACAPDTYKDLPIPEKEEYEFEGWYLDKELTKKLEAINTKDISPIPKKDQECVTGYEDITLYAKYNKLELMPFPLNYSGNITNLHFNFDYINSTTIKATIFNEK